VKLNRWVEGTHPKGNGKDGVIIRYKDIRIKELDREKDAKEQ